MTELIDELGPVDWIVVEFPGSRFNGEIAPTITDLVESAAMESAAGPATEAEEAQEPVKEGV